MSNIIPFKSRDKAMSRAGWVVLCGCAVIIGFGAGMGVFGRLWPDRAYQQAVASPAPEVIRYGQPSAPAKSADPDVISTTFRKCRSAPRFNCVVDGDTFYLNGTAIRIADIDAPETGGARCPEEAALGDRATVRLAELLSAGPFTVRSFGSRDEDRYGRQLRVVMRDGRSIGGMLVDAGLARPWQGRRRPWCAASL